MPLNKVPKLREPNGPIVQQVRDIFIEREYKQTPEDFYLEDVRLVEQMAFLLQRCVIMQRKDVDESVKMLASLLRWRKSKRIYEMDESQLPSELTMVGGAFTYEPDKFGNRTLYLRASLCKSCAELKQAMKDFLTFLMFKLDDPAEGSTYAVIMDLTNASLSNYDVDLLKFIVTLLKDYFPVNMDYFLAINFPWILSVGWRLIKHLIPAEKRDAVQFVGSEQIFDFVDKENCPDFLGGTSTRPYKYTNEQAPDTIRYLELNAQSSISHKRLKEILHLFDDILPKDHMKRQRARIEQMKDGIRPIDENKIARESIGDANNNAASHPNKPLEQRA